jgi:glyoxylase-like metal-dependent hydrolase (beta-lactamase superfamily II)
VHRLGNWFVNWYLVEDGGRLTAVDAGLPRFKGSLESDVAALGFGLGDLEAVILTHSDGDHTGLATALHDSGARVLISATDEPTLRKPGPKPGDASPIHIVPDLWRPTLLRVIATMVADGGMKLAKFDGAETFGVGDVLDVPGRPRAVATPGHTPGHCVFHFEEHSTVFVGDAMCSFNVVTGSRGPQLMPHAMNQSNAQALKSLDAIEPIEAEVMVFGHGEPWRAGVGSAVELARAAASS